MMPINLTRTNLPVYSCFWLFFSPSTNMLSFLCLVTIPATQCLLPRIFVLLLYYSLCLTAWFLRAEWASPAFLAGALLEHQPSASLWKLIAGAGMMLNQISCEHSPSALFWVYVLDSLCVLGQAIKALAALPLEGLCEQSRLSRSCSPARLVWSQLRAFLWSRLVKVKPLISTCWVWPSACTHQGWADNCTQRKMENRI